MGFSKFLAGAALALAIVPTTGSAASELSGSYNGMNWKARSTIIGQTSTATLAGGGNPLYFASQPQKSGVVALIMEYADGSAFICSGSLLKDRVSIVTAGHCVSDGAGTANPIKTTAYFYNGTNPDTVVPFNPAATAVEVKDYHVNPLYTGEVIDQNDVAILRLKAPAPAFATAYDIYNGGDLTGVDFNVAGYGRRSLEGGSVGADLGTGRLREGDNTYDFRLGDAAFGGVWSLVLGGTADYDYSYISDFDNGTAANDGSCIVSEIGLGLPTGSFCGTGLGAREVSIAGGDSGGPGFVNGMIASVNSYGLSFGSDYGDSDNALNSSFGEMNGFVPLYIHQAWISSVVPEPASWAMMISGFGLIGGALRRQRRTLVVSA